MSSPRRRIETDVSPTVFPNCYGTLTNNIFSQGHEVRCRLCPLACGIANMITGCMKLNTSYRFYDDTDTNRLMSDYEVTLVNDNSKNSLFASKDQLRVCISKRNVRTITDITKLHLRAECGRFMSNFPTPTLTSPLALASSTESFTLTSTSCTKSIPPSGSVCLDVINQTWSPMFDMINIFEVFLPQLLRYPNPTDPLNGEAAALLIREPKSYDAKVKVEYVQKYASKEAADEAGAESEDDDELSSVASFGDDDEEPAGQMDDV
ncbi:hypothetical protein Lal_00008353 [Lupinus albus]|nr:hypothetical protein Lal_00008353 [Lupinus albus]